MPPGGVRAMLHVYVIGNITSKSNWWRATVATFCNVRHYDTGLHSLDTPPDEEIGDSTPRAYSRLSLETTRQSGAALVADCRPILIDDRLTAFYDSKTTVSDVMWQCNENAKKFVSHDNRTNGSMQTSIRLLTFVINELRTIVGWYSECKYWNIVRYVIVMTMYAFPECRAACLAPDITVLISRYLKETFLVRHKLGLDKSLLHNNFILSQNVS